MRLTDIDGVAGIAVKRDSDFQSLGFVSDRRPGLLVFLENAQFLAPLRRNKGVTAVLTTAQLADIVPPALGLAISPDPRIGFAGLHHELSLRGFYWQDFPTVIDPAAQVHPSAFVAERNVRIGPGSVVQPKAAILERCLIGADVVVGAGAVLGGVGFQTVRSARPMLEMDHAGGLVVHDRARILPGAVIATGLFLAPTLVGADSRIGSNAFVSHGVQLGERVFIGHGSVINGNVAIGAEAWIGPGAVVTQNLTVGERAFVSLGSVVIRNVRPEARVSGNFAMPHRRLLRMLGSLDQDHPG